MPKDSQSQTGVSLFIHAALKIFISSVLAEFQKPNSVNTLITILTLCSVPEPEQTLSALVRHVLEPGGSTLQSPFSEHVLNLRNDVAWWQLGGGVSGH
jgi:hypothetical protein